MKNKVKNASSAEPPVPGSILSNKNKLTAENELFIVIGQSGDKIALVRLFEQGKFNLPATGRYLLSYKIKAVKNSPQLLLQLYADLSKLIVKELRLITTLLDDHPGSLAGIVHKREMEQIKQGIADSNTISTFIKNKYLGLL